MGLKRSYLIDPCSPRIAATTSDQDKSLALDLLQILEIDEPFRYKLHAARSNGHDEPLDVFSRDRNEWRGWNTWRGTRDEFNRPHVISFIRFYPERASWLFGGVFKILERREPGEGGYVVEESSKAADLIGRLKVKAEISRGRAFLFENVAPSMVIGEILPKPYSGEPFVGFDSVSLSFGQLDAIVRNDRLDWKTALQNMKGVYVIVDSKTGKKYVGSAYGDVGIWQRWCVYIATGHGGNRGLVDHLANGGARENFRITLLEAWPARTDDQFIIKRENYWKDALLTRGDFGYNRN